VRLTSRLTLPLQVYPGSWSIPKSGVATYVTRRGAFLSMNPPPICSRLQIRPRDKRSRYSVITCQLAIPKALLIQHKSNASRPRIFATNNSRPGRHAASQTSHAALSWFHSHTASSGRWPLAGDQGSSREAVCTYDDTCEVRHGAMDELR
jgi:hypothetical protein